MQVLAVVGAVLVFLLWQLTPRRRASSASLSPPPPGTLTINMQDLGLLRWRAPRGAV